MRLFSSVNIVVDKILGDQIWIGIEVEELPKISAFAFTGTSKSEDEDMRPLLDIVGNVTPYADLPEYILKIL